MLPERYSDIRPLAGPTLTNCGSAIHWEPDRCQAQIHWIGKKKHLFAGRYSRRAGINKRKRRSSQKYIHKLGYRGDKAGARGLILKQTFRVQLSITTVSCASRRLLKNDNCDACSSLLGVSCHGQLKARRRGVAGALVFLGRRGFVPHGCVQTTCRERAGRKSRASFCRGVRPVPADRNLPQGGKCCGS